jgi:hypothetical protein
MHPICCTWVAANRIPYRFIGIESIGGIGYTGIGHVVA